MTSYYFAARFSKRSELRRYRKQLTRLGHTVTSRWLDGRATENAATAARDLADIETADICIWFTEQPRCPSRGGRHFEAGYAAGCGKGLIIIGGVENIFGYLDCITRFDCWSECLAALSNRVQPPPGIARGGRSHSRTVSGNPASMRAR
jgi:nucleoside 2-deoxyribosyltransferase